MNLEITPTATLLLMARLTMIPLLVQSFELFTLIKVFNSLKDDRLFKILLKVRIFVCLVVLLFPHPLLLGYLLAFIFYLSSRLHGSYNGGSDSMQATLLLMAFVGSLAPTHSVILKVALTYVGVQSLLSYFIAGLVKIPQADWRSGKILKDIAQLSNYAIPVRLIRTFDQPILSFMSAWSILIFELGAPIIFVSKEFCLYYLAVAFIFHLLNSLIFGLNLFWMTWLATYPAILLISQIW